MRDLPLGLRAYVCGVCAAAVSLIVVQLGIIMAWNPLWPSPRVMVLSVVIFVGLTYAGERATFKVNGSVSQSLSTAVHIAGILLFPVPFPPLIALVAMLLSQLLHTRLPLYKRIFNACHTSLTVGLTGWVFSHIAAPTTVLRPGHVVCAVPALLLLMLLYYMFDTTLILGVLTLAQGRWPWQIWWQMHRHAFLPELAASTMGIFAAVAWQYDHVLLGIFAVPVVALRIAYRAISQAEDRALALRRRSEQLEAVLTAGQRLRLQQSQAELLHPLAEAARAVVNAAAVAVYLRDPDDPTMLERVVLLPPSSTHMPSTRLPVPAPGRGLPTPDGGSLLVPLELEGSGVAGLLWLLDVPPDLGHDDHDALAILATQAAIALDNARLHERALNQASEDGLTGLLNHRAFQTRLEQEIARAQRSARPLSLLMIDLDGFGAVNNTYGHQTGDAALIAVANALNASLRSTDVAARYGGDEFAVILPETEVEEAEIIAERVRAAVAATTVVESGVPIQVGTSVGLAAYPQHARSRDALVRAADHALYAAKHAGKGRTTRPEDAAFPLDRDPDALAARLEHANMATVEALAAAVDAKDPYTRGHSQRVSAYAAAIAEAMGLSAADVARVRLAGLLHDVGKIGVPDAILSKPGKLTAQEFALIAQHPVIGETLLGAVPFLRAILPAVRHHHERWDGSGYPDGLAGEAIPRDAAILAVADAFDAMTSSRTYRPALPVEEARRRVREGSGTQLDPRLVRAFELAFAEDAAFQAIA